MCFLRFFFFFFLFVRVDIQELGSTATRHGDLHARHNTADTVGPPGQLRDHQDPARPRLHTAYASRCSLRVRYFLLSFILDKDLYLRQRIFFYIYFNLTKRLGVAIRKLKIFFCGVEKNIQVSWRSETIIKSKLETTYT